MPIKASLETFQANIELRTANYDYKLITAAHCADTIRVTNEDSFMRFNG